MASVHTAAQSRTFCQHRVAPIAKVWPEQPDVHQPHKRQQGEPSSKQCSVTRGWGVSAAQPATTQHMSTAPHKTGNIYIALVRRALLKVMTSPSMVSISSSATGAGPAGCILVVGLRRHPCHASQTKLRPDQACSTRLLTLSKLFSKGPHCRTLCLPS